MIDKKELLNLIRRMQMEDNIDSNHNNFVYQTYKKVIDAIESLDLEVDEDDGK